MPADRDASELGELHTRAARGDRDAQAALLNALQDSIFRFCCARLFDRESARDATQETALRIISGLKRFKGRSSMRTWALGIALNVCREKRRDARRPEPDLSFDDVASPESDALKNESIERLRTMLNELPDRQREAIVLRFFEDLSVDETASVMGIAPGTVKATVFQALRAMRRRMDDE